MFILISAKQHCSKSDTKTKQRDFWADVHLADQCLFVQGQEPQNAQVCLHPDRTVKLGFMFYLWYDALKISQK